MCVYIEKQYTIVLFLLLYHLIMLLLQVKYARDNYQESFFSAVIGAAIDGVITGFLVGDVGRGRHE